MKDVLMIASIVAGVMAGALAIAAARIEIRDNLDMFMSDIHRQGTWASYAALSAAIAAVLQALHYFLSR